MSLLLGIIVVRLAVRPGGLSHSYQLDVSSFHRLFHVSPPQHPNITPIEFHNPSSLFSLHLHLPCISQYTTEDCVVFIGLVNHTNPTSGVVQLPQTCGERRQKSSVIMRGEKVLVVVQILRLEM
jgi:hypothetical protein